MKKILISTSVFGEYDKVPLDKLKNAGFAILMNPYGRQLKPEETSMLLDGVIGMVAGTEILSGDILSGANSLKIISRCGTGTDNVDKVAAARLGIKVLNTPDVPTEAVAELTMAFILAFYRRIPQLNAGVKNGKWPQLIGRSVAGKKLGVVGLGRIGRRVVEMSSCFRIEPLAFEVSPDADFIKRFNVKLVSLEQLLSQSDIVTIHVPLSAMTRGMIGQSQLSMMKDEAILINTSRGGIVDEEALLRYLKDRKIAGACLDVFGDEPYNGGLLKEENVILTPHIGTYTKETRKKMEAEAVDNLLKALNEKEIS